MNKLIMRNLVVGLYKLHTTGKGGFELFEAMDYDHWVYAMEDDKPTSFLKCTYGDMKDKQIVLKALPKEIKKFVQKTTDEVWKELYDKSWSLWYKEYYDVISKF